jgi:hypothetical protein
MSWQKVAVVVVAVLITVLIAWLGRYTVIGVSPGGQEGGHGYAYRLDRWTGEVAWMIRDEGGVISIGKY